MTVILAAIQMTSGADVTLNLQIAERLVRQAADAGAQLVVLPENVAYLGLRDTGKLAVQEPFGAGPIQQTLSDMARQCRIYLVAGTIPLATADAAKVTASSLVFDPNGACVARYDKMHLFDVNVSANEAYRESESVQSGSSIVVVKTPFATVGLSVCYDIRFPELYREQMRQGATILCIPSAFTYTTGLAHWMTLARARAIENLCYVIAPNQTGYPHPQRRCYGHSVIIDYWGRELAHAAEGNAVLLAEYSSVAQTEQRQRFPALNHRIVGLTDPKNS